MMISEVGGEGEEFEKTNGVSILSQIYRVPEEKGYTGFKFGRGKEGLYFFERFGILARVSTYHRSVSIWKIESDSLDSNTPKRKMDGKEEMIFLECEVILIQKGHLNRVVSTFKNWKDRFIVFISEPKKANKISKKHSNKRNHIYFFDCFNVFTPSQLSFRNQTDIGLHVNKVVNYRDDILILFGDYLDPDEKENPYRLISISNEGKVKLESDVRKLKFGISDNLVVHSKLHSDCSYYLSESGIILFNFITNNFIRFIFGCDMNEKRESFQKREDPFYDISSIYEFRPFILSDGKEYLVSAGNFTYFYVHDTHKDNELIHKIDIIKGTGIGHRSCWYSCLIDDAYFVCGNHDKTVSFNHIDSSSGLLRKVDEVEIYNSYGSGIRAIRLIEKKATQLRFIVQYSLSSTSHGSYTSSGKENKEYFTILTLTNVPFLKPNKLFVDDEDEKERSEYVLDKFEDYFTVDEMREFGIEIIVSQNFRLRLSKLFLQM